MVNHVPGTFPEHYSYEMMEMLRFLQREMLENEYNFVRHSVRSPDYSENVVCFESLSLCYFELLAHALTLHSVFILY